MDENYEPGNATFETPTEELPAQQAAVPTERVDTSPEGGGWVPTPPPAQAGAPWTFQSPPVSPATSWTPPPQSGSSGPPWAPQGPAGGGPPWAAPGAPYWAAPPPPPQPPAGRSRRAKVVLAAALLVVVAMLAGFGVGRATFQPRSVGSTLPSTTSPSSGSGSLPFGTGPSGPSGFTGPTGSGSSSSSGSGAPANDSAIAAKADPGLVDVNTTLNYQHAEAAGTGIVLTSTGEVLTNNHVIDGATSVSVTDIGNGRTYSATVVGYDRTSDVAVLQLSGASGLQVATIGNSSDVSVGEPVVAIGNAGGTGGKPSVAGGSVTGLGKSITATEQDGANPEQLTGLIETNADIQPGDSGGPIVNSDGKVVGMDTAASTGFSFQTSSADGYAIPINSATAIAGQVESGAASNTVHIGPTGFLGVEVNPTGSASGASLGGVLSGSPAQSAGLGAGDTITSLDGNAVTSASSLSLLMERYHPGDSVQVGWADANGNHHVTSVQLTTGPAA